MTYELDHNLLLAAHAGDLPRAAALLDAGANPNAQDLLCSVSALQFAAAAGHLPLVQLLIRHGADLNAITGDAPQSPLEAAAVAGRLNVVEFLLSLGARLPDPADLAQLLCDIEETAPPQIAALLRNAPRPAP